jgi:cobalt-zinc-cadmium efflux system protein
LHNFTDVISLIISYIASIFSRKNASVERTFGFKRAEIVAAFVNALSLIVISIILVIEAIERLITPQEIESNPVIVLSIVAIIGNGLSVFLLHGESSKNMNMKSVYLHLFTDMLASVAVLIGGLLMKYYLLFWTDSLLTLLIAAYLLYMSWDLLQKSFKVMMLFTPNDININEISNTINSKRSVTKLHHVHVWQLNEQEVHLEAHILLAKDLSISQFEIVLQEIRKDLKELYGINHVTIQPEFLSNDPKDTIVQD